MKGLAYRLDMKKTQNANDAVLLCLFPSYYSHVLCSLGSVHQVRLAFCTSNDRFATLPISTENRRLPTLPRLRISKRKEGID